MISCEAWLRLYLLDAPALCDEVRKGAAKAGFTRSELKQARKVLKVKTHHKFKNGKPTDQWYWEM